MKKLLISTLMFLLLSLVYSFINKKIVNKITCDSIEIGCLVHGRDMVGEYVINDSTTYYSLLNYKSPHYSCDGYELPYINFETHTLIGYISSTGGCSPPVINHNIIKDGSNYFVNIESTQIGFCKALFSYSIWCVIPKINEFDNVHFEISNTIEQ